MASLLVSSLNESWDYSGLSEWQRLQLDESSSVSEAECFLDMWLNHSDDNMTSGLFCNATWDHFYCWPPTPSGTIVKRHCSHVLPEAKLKYSIPLIGNVIRICLQNGTWAQGKKSNYKECAKSFKSSVRKAKDDDVLFLMVQYTLFIGSALSIICLAISLGVFYFYRLLRCDRVTVQAHLMVSLVIRFILMFVIAEPHVFNHDSSFRDVNILCELVLLGFLYSTFSSVSWMFIQGLYLNITLMGWTANNVGRYQILIYNLIGWAIPALFILVYVIAMLLRDQERCWDGYSEMTEMWILLFPIILEVVMSGVFLMNILWILLKKLRNSHARADASQIKSAAKATAFLFPVLGINNLLLLYNPGGDFNKFYVALNIFFGSTQGIFVALVYCFINKEVWAAVHRSVDRTQARRSCSVAHESEHHSRARPSCHTMIELATLQPQTGLDTNCSKDEV